MTRAAGGRAGRHHRHHAGHPLAAGAHRRRRDQRGPARRADAGDRARPARHERAGRAVAARAPAAVVGRPGCTAGDRALHGRRARRRPVDAVEHRVHPPHQRAGSPSTTSTARCSTRATWCWASATSTSARRSPTPLDPRHRLVTTKYNPARTWTAENSVGIGGAYLCIYGMEGPGGYQLVGRTTQVWNRLPPRRPVRTSSRGRCGSSTASSGTRSRPTSCSSCGPRPLPAAGRSTPRTASSRSPTTSGSWPTTQHRSAEFREPAVGRVRGGEGALARVRRVRRAGPSRRAAVAGAPIDLPAGSTPVEAPFVSQRVAGRRREPATGCSAGDRVRGPGGDEDGDRPWHRRSTARSSRSTSHPGEQVMPGQVAAWRSRRHGMTSPSSASIAAYERIARRSTGPRLDPPAPPEPTRSPRPRRRRRVAAGRVAAAGRARGRGQGQHRRGRHADDGRCRLATPTCPQADATAVARLRAAGAVVLGKTNLDQFATGLVGTRSPYGAVRNAWDPERISGGSSSGSAVAVALGIADVALGTDTAGSGRVPGGAQRHRRGQADQGPRPDDRRRAGLPDPTTA